MKLRKAQNTDVPQIRALINEMAARTDEDHKHGHMLPRSLTELYEHIRDYTVLVDGENRIMGCCALQSVWDGLAELKALAVNDALQGQGWGRKLVAAALSEADGLGIDCVYTLTNKMEFFEKLDFVPIDMRELPQRVWSECTNCPKFMVACDEVAMSYQGRHPKQTFIPAVGVNASPAAHRALGLVGPMNTDGKRPPFAPPAPPSATNGASQKKDMLGQGHMKPLIEYWERVRLEQPDKKIPCFDPCDGGINARALFLLEAPGPKAVDTGFISRNNPDPTAKNLCDLLGEAGIARCDTLIWNIVPWYVGEGDGSRIRPVNKQDIQQAVPYLKGLIDLLKRLE
ncbi:MAG: N-acetyltransferase, partial [Armatimonadota bacterium]|nr:N-acetyltransferase [Armatimonadota bacterium]